MTKLMKCCGLAALLIVINQAVIPAYAGEETISREPAWTRRNAKEIENLANIETISVKLKPHVRVYIKRHYDWGHGKTEDRHEEALMNQDEAAKLSKAAGVKLTPLRASGGDQELKLPHSMTIKEARAIAEKVAAHPDVEYAEPNEWFSLQRIPNDTLYQSSQWDLQNSVGGVNLPWAWDTDIGGTNIVVAVLDSGILANHTDLVGRTVPGYDFISDPVVANDGGGRDADPTDPGNWVNQADVTAYPTKFPSGCISPSSWHGTHVAGIIGANSNNSYGMTGVNWISKILPVRVTGKCGGAAGDLKDAMRWAAGIPVSGVPNNLNPANVVNLSIGSNAPAACPAILQSAIDDVIKKNVVVVAAAGNSSDLASNYWPANCNNVVTVGAVNRQGAQSSYTNTGSAVLLSAAGGDYSSYDIDKIKSTGDSGLTNATNDNAFILEYGTSQATPHVSGVASLMLSANYKHNFRQIKSMLQKTAKAFPTNTGKDCTTALCGAGIADATAAVHAAESGIGGGAYHSAALKADGSVWSWGYNGNGQLGDGSTLSTLRTSPGPLSILSAGVKDLAAGVYHNTAMKSDGTVWAWGYNAYGQLGNNATADQGIPVQVPSLAGMTAIAAGYDHTLALKSDGTVWAWGYNFFGQLGDGTYVDKHVPFQVSGLTGIVAIAAGGKRSIALKNDGTVWAWGDVANVTNATTASVSNIPLQVTGLTDVIAIAAAGDATTGVDVDTSLALKSDGTVWAWGYNSFGQLGDGTLSSKFLPVQVSGLTDVISIAAGIRYFSTAVKSDGTVWVWGNGYDGQLGNGSSGNLVYSSSPVKSLGVNKAVAIAAGAGHVLALDADLTIQEWGANNGGQLGNGTTSSYSIALQTIGQGGVGTFNTANATTGQADLSVTLSQAPLPAVAGNPLTYSFNVTNLGSGIASNANVTLALPGSTNFISASPSCTQGSGVVTCNLGNMGSSALTGLQVTVSPSTAGTLNSTVYVASDSVDPNYANNNAAVSTTVNPGYTDSDVPTLPQWGMIVMGSLLLASMGWMDRKRRVEPRFETTGL